MHCCIQAPQPRAARGRHDCRNFGSRSWAGDIASLRPIRAILGRHDYWQLNEHRRRCEELGTSDAMRLARLIRATMSDATVLADIARFPDIVTGLSRVTFSRDGLRPEIRQLYHWDYPDHDRFRLPVGTFLGVTLIGMTVGQHMPLPTEPGIGGTLQVLRVQTHSRTCGMPFD